MFDYLVFVDESGDLGTKGTPFFVVAALELKDERLVERIIKRARMKKLRGLKTTDELKAFRSRPRVREFVLRKIAELDCRVFVQAIEKPEHLDSKRQAALYDAACVELCENVQGPRVNVVLDKKYTRKVDREKLDAALRALFIQRGLNATIGHFESYSRPALQAVDFIAWAALQKFARNDDSYYRLIEPKVASRTIWKPEALLEKHQRFR